MHDTICGVATPMGEGGIGIVRVSGEKATEVASAVVRLRCGKPLAEVRSRTLYRADVRDGAGPAGRGSGLVDDALVVVMRAPHSYTGETVVEVQCHGGALVLELLCGALVAAGARMAEPGEFTKRAFLNGRLDLAQAEAVLDTIRAKTEGGLRIAQEHLRGTLSKEIGRLRDDLIGVLAHVEAAIDFTEEDIRFIDSSTLGERLASAIAALGRLTDSAREGRIFREGVTATIVGRPNVGKSSLLNALCLRDRAIVTAVPGTTRDVLDELLSIRGVPVRLLDTAGIRAGGDEVEREGIRRSQSALEDADLVLLVVDGSVPLTDEDREVAARTQGRPRVVVVNKCDLPQRLSAEELQEVAGGEGDGGIVTVSAKTAAGLDQLRDRLRARFIRPDFEPGDTPTVTRLRHLSALERARESLCHTVRSLEAGMDHEFIALDLRVALDALGEVTGATTTDDILDRIFSEFCIGK